MLWCCGKFHFQWPIFFRTKNQDRQSTSTAGNFTIDCLVSRPLKVSEVAGDLGRSESRDGDETAVSSTWHGHETVDVFRSSFCVLIQAHY